MNRLSKANPISSARSGTEFATTVPASTPRTDSSPIAAA